MAAEESLLKLHRSLTRHIWPLGFAVKMTITLSQCPAGSQQIFKQSIYASAEKIKSGDANTLRSCRYSNHQIKEIRFFLSLTRSHSELSTILLYTIITLNF